MRRGARRMSEIPPKVLRSISRGEMEAVSLVEMLAVDMRVLMGTIDAALAKSLADELDPAKPFIGRMKVAGHALAAAYPKRLNEFSTHRSDIVRGWAAYMVAKKAGDDVGKALKAIMPLADDPHSGVREWAWIAVRPQVGADVSRSLALLTPWSKRSEPNLRRFASEVTRPRGVWCAHIDSLKQDPSPALELLTNLNADTSVYVQNSVGNWLNDASKTNAAWVREVCDRWKRGVPESAATRRICSRALRTLNKDE